MDEKERRDAFNMKVLKRHDPNIVDIVGSASFVVLYELDGEWTKLGIEGPLFLYRRSVSPVYGFFVLNRNGVENFSAMLTSSDDLEVTKDFVIYRANAKDQVLGIWVYDADERQSVGPLMAKLHASAADPPNRPAPDSSSTSSASSAWPHATSSSPTRQHAGQSISLDALFGSSPFASSSPEKPAPAPAPAPSGPALLNSIFQSAYTAPPAPFSHSADGLKALLGLPTSTNTSTANSATVPSQPVTKTPVAPSVPVNGTTTQSDRSEATFARTASAALDSALAQRPPTSTTTLDRRDFIREVLSLIHTDQAFVDGLYHEYLARVS